MEFEVWLAYAIGYAFSVFLGNFFIGRVVDQLWKSVGWTGDTRHNKTNIRPGAWIPPITGFVERVLFTASLQIGKPEFIGIWLAVKVASQWKRWSEEEHRSRFQIFLIGNGLSVLYGGVGFKIIEWISSGGWVKALIVAAAVVLMTEGLKCWAGKNTENVREDQSN